MVSKQYSILDKELTKIIVHLPTADNKANEEYSKKQNIASFIENPKEISTGITIFHSIGLQADTSINRKNGPVNINIEKLLHYIEQQESSDILEIIEKILKWKKT